MSTIEKIFAGLLVAGETIAPVFIKSSQGILIFNASEEALLAFLGAIAGSVPTPTPAPASTPTPASSFVSDSTHSAE